MAKAVNILDSRQALEELANLLKKIGGSTEPGKVIESLSLLARVSELHRKDKGWPGLSDNQLLSLVTVASLSWAVEYGLEPDSLIRCWRLVVKRQLKESSRDGWWDLMNTPWESADYGSNGVHHFGPYGKHRIPKPCQFGLPEGSYPTWRVVQALEEQLAWFRLKLKRAKSAGDAPWNPLPDGSGGGFEIGAEYRSLFRGGIPSDCGIGSPFSKEIDRRSFSRDLPPIDKEFELKVLRDAISSITGRLTPLRNRVIEQRMSDKRAYASVSYKISSLSWELAQVGVE